MFSIFNQLDLSKAHKKAGNPFVCLLLVGSGRVIICCVTNSLKGIFGRTLKCKFGEQSTKRGNKDRDYRKEFAGKGRLKRLCFTH